MHDVHLLKFMLWFGFFFYFGLFLFVESMKWLGIKACLPFFLNCAVRHEHWI